MTSDQSAKPTFTIIHGFGEGPKISRNLRRELTARGFCEDSAIRATVIIAHSAGCLEIPADTEARLILFVNPSPFVSKRLMIQAMLHKVWLDFLISARQDRLPWWFYKSFWNTWYIVSRPAYNRRIYRITKDMDGRLPRLTAKNDRRQVVVINSQYDPWANLFDDSQILDRADYAYITYPGTHDQIWMTASDYAGIVQSWYESAD